MTFERVVMLRSGGYCCLPCSVYPGAVVFRCCARRESSRYSCPPRCLGMVAHHAAAKKLMFHVPMSSPQKELAIKTAAIEALHDPRTGPPSRGSRSSSDNLDSQHESKLVPAPVIVRFIDAYSFCEQTNQERGWSYHAVPAPQKLLRVRVRFLRLVTEADRINATQSPNEGIQYLVHWPPRSGTWRTLLPSVSP